MGFDADGNALAVWTQTNGATGGSIWSSHFVPGSGWDAPVLVETEPTDVGFDRSIYVSHHTVAGGWETQRRIEPGQGGHDPEVAFDADGNALAILDLSLPSAAGYSVWGNRYTAGSGWTSAEQIGSNGSLISTFMPNLAIDPNGDAFAIWTRSAEVRVNRFE